MFYKNFNSIGIRQKFGKKRQILSFGGKNCKLNEAALRGVADQALQKLDNDMDLDEVSAWLSATMA